MHLYLFLYAKEYSCEVKVAQLYPTLCNPMNYSQPVLSVHEILQARILEWVAILFSRGSSQPSDRTWVSCIAGWFFTIWATREVQRIFLDFIKYFPLMLVRNNLLYLSGKPCLYRHQKVRYLVYYHKFQVMGLQFNEVLFCRMRNVNSMPTESYLSLLQQVALTLNLNVQKSFKQSKTYDI